MYDYVGDNANRKPKNRHDRGLDAQMKLKSIPQLGWRISLLLLCATSAASLLASSANASTAPGYLDPAFARNGIFDVPPWPSRTQQVPTATVGTGDGAFFVLSSVAWSNSNADIAVSKFTRGGSFDRQFGHKGRALAGIGGKSSSASALPSDIVRQPDGKVVVLGTLVKQFARSDESRQILVLRFTKQGQLDSSFGTNGRFIGSFHVKKLVKQYAFRLALDARGRVVVAGDAITRARRDDFALLRITKSGAIDRSFGRRGTALVRVAKEPAYDVLKAILPRSNGTILLGGETCELKTCNARAVLARVDSSGRLDRSFGPGGVRRFRFGSGPTKGLYGNSIDDFARQNGNKITVAATVAVSVDAGGSGGVDTNSAVAQFDPDGKLDPSFGTNGLSLEQAQGPRANQRTVGSRILRGTDGMLYTAGASAFELDGELVEYGCLLQRFSPSGAFDSNWGHKGTACLQNGIYPLEAGLNYGIESGSALAESRDGIVLGTASKFTDSKLRIGLLKFTK